MDDEELADMFPGASIDVRTTAQRNHSSTKTQKTYPRLLYVGFRVAEKLAFFPPRVIVRRPRRFSTLSSAPCAFSRTRVGFHEAFDESHKLRVRTTRHCKNADISRRCTRPMIYDNGGDDDDDDDAAA